MYIEVKTEEHACLSMRQLPALTEALFIEKLQTPDSWKPDNKNDEKEPGEWRLNPVAGLGR